MAKKIGNMSSLQFALSNIVDEPQKPDEFSINDFLDEAKKIDKNIVLSMVRARIIRMYNEGLLTKRQIRRNGTMVNLYTKA
jgi:hypothetical protein